VKAKIKIMDTQAVDGNFNNGPIRNHGRNADPDRFLFLNDPLSMAIYTGEEPITSGTTALAAGIKHRHTQSNSDSATGFFRRENHFDI